MNVALRRLHSEQTPLVGPHDSALIGNADLSAYDNRERLRHKFPHDTREGCIRHFLQTDPGVQQTADLEMVVLLILNVHVGCLRASALIGHTLFVKPLVIAERLESPLDFQEHLLISQSTRLMPGCSQRRLDPSHQALEL